MRDERHPCGRHIGIVLVYVVVEDTIVVRRLVAVQEDLGRVAAVNRRPYIPDAPRRAEGKFRELEIKLPVVAETLVHLQAQDVAHHSARRCHGQDNYV